MDENKEIETEIKEDAPETAEVSAADKNGKLMRDIADIVESTLSTVFVIMLIFTYLLHPVNVKGESMKPTLNDYDRILMTTVFFDLEYGDIVIVDNNEAFDIDENGNPVGINIDGKQLDECIIKRVIATGGQTIDIRDGKVFVDDKELNEPYIAKGAKTYAMSGFSGKYPVTVPEGYYFVMGDNREHSSDSRHSDVGLIKKSQIYGKALVRYSPLKEFRFLWDTEK